MAVNFPDSPVNGDSFSVNDTTYVYNATAGYWDITSTVQASASTGTNAPSNPSSGDLWFDPSSLTTYIYYSDGNSSQWIPANSVGARGAPGPGYPTSYYSVDYTSTATGNVVFNSSSSPTLPSYTVGKVNAWVNGVLRSDIEASDGSNVEVSLSTGDEVQIINFGDTDILDPTASSNDHTTYTTLSSLIDTVQANVTSAGSGVAVYATPALLPLSGTNAGEQAYVNSTNRLYINNGTGWYSIGLVNSSPSITSVLDGDSNTTPFTLSTDGSASIITITAADPEDIPLTYTYSITGGSLTNGGGTTATVTQGTGVNNNQFTVTPTTTTAYAGTFSLTFTASDGINTATSDSSFTLNFIVTVANSRYTVMLAQAVGANNGTNSSLTDSSPNNSTLTTSGSPVAGTFSPYRSSGYSTNFVTSSYLTSGMTALSTSNYTIECWVNFRDLAGSPWILEGRYDASNNSYGNGSLGVRIESSGKLRAYHSSSYIDGTTVLSLDTWHHVMVVRSGTGTNEFKVYLDGSLEVQGTDANSKTCTHFKVGAAYNGGNNPKAHIRDLRISNTARATTSPTEPVEADSNTLWLGCNKPYIVDVSASSNSVTVTGDVATKPFGPYDYSEYDAAYNGGSIYFDGTSDNRVIVAHDASLNPSGAWTIECWFYLTDMTDWSSIFSKFDNATSNRSYHLRINSDGSGRVIMSSSGTASDKGYTFTPTSGAFTTGQWYHFAQVYDGSGTYKYYVNGVAQTDYSWSGTPYAGSADFLIGTWQNGSTHYGDLNKAYVSDLRLVIGTAVYSGASLTVPTAPLGNITNTKLLVKGTDASIIDKSGSTALTLVGDAKCSTTQVKFASSKSMYFDGAGDRITAHNLPEIGNSDFTFETWMYETLHDNNAAFFDLRGVGGSGWRLESRSGNIRWGDGTLASGSSLSINTWYHIALCRQGSSTKIYINGTQTGPTYTDTNDYTYGAADRPIFGGNGYNLSAGHYTGYLQDIRLTIGLARYTANFTPPTASLEG